MELRQVQYFLALSEARNFTRAAEQCNVTQPTLTTSIKKLERELGGPLVHREGRNTHLTELGETMLPFLKQVYESSKAACNLAREITEGRRVLLKFGVSDIINKSALVDPISDADASSEGLELHIEGGSDADLVRRLEDGGLQLVLLDGAAVTHDSLRFHPIYNEHFAVLMPARDPLACEPQLPLDVLTDRTWISVIDSPVHNEFIETIQEVEGGWMPHHRATRSTEAQLMCQAGIGLTLIGSNEPVLPGLVARALSVPGLRRVVGLAEARGRRLSSAALAFARMLRAVSYDDSAASA